MIQEPHQPLEAPELPQYGLRLYVAGVTPRSILAVETIKRICEQNLKGRYQLAVIDIHQQPKLAKGDQIIAVPTLIRVLPKPQRILIGDMSNENRVLIGLDLKRHDSIQSKNAVLEKVDPQVDVHAD